MNPIPPLLLVGLVTVLSFYGGKLGRYVRLPSIIGYMVVGVLLGPSVIGLLGEQDLGSLGFINQVALGFVAFAIGSELSLRALRALGPGIGIIILSESFAAFGVVLAAVYLVTGNLPLALVFASMAPASAPAGTVAVIQECRARGKLTTALYAVVGFDDGLAIFIFAFAFAAAKTMLEGQASGAAAGMLATMAAPGRELLFSVVVGSVSGLIFSFLVSRLGQARDMLILVVGFVLINAGVAEALHASLILTNLAAGFVMVNTRSRDLVAKVGHQVTSAMPLIFVLFFSLAGAHLRVSVLPSLGGVGVVYVLARSAGLMGGAALGALVGRADAVIRKYLGLGILSQAGVAIGLALIVKSEFADVSPRAADIGTAVLTTVTATSIIFEIVGPILTRIALSRAREIPEESAT